MLSEKELMELREYYGSDDYFSLKAGELVEFEDGEYSDHQVWFPMRVIKDFDLKELFDEYIKDKQEQLEYGRENYQMFVSFLVRSGCIDDVENVVRRISLGGSGEWECGLTGKYN